MKRAAFQVALVGLVAMGCQSYRRSEPQILLDYQAQVAAQYVPLDPDQQERNRVISNMLLLIDVDYAEFEASLYHESSLWNTAADLTILGASAAATVAGGEGVKAGLAALIAATSGTRATVSRNFYAEQSWLPMITTMRALRAAELVEIEFMMQKPADEYPLAAAVVDLFAYYQAGTVVSALQSITETSSARLREAMRLSQQLRIRRPEAVNEILDRRDTERTQARWRDLLGPDPGEPAR